MCFKNVTVKQKTIEEIIAGNSAGMTDLEKAQYAYELNLQVHRILTKVDGVEIYQITPDEFIRVALAQYPTLANFNAPDSYFTITNEAWMQEILRKDWSNLVPYIVEVGDCDKFANRLYIHLCDYYGITGALEVWGWVAASYHSFNLTVLKEGEGHIARLIEPQTDAIFIEDGPVGRYQPDRFITRHLTKDRG